MKLYIKIWKKNDNVDTILIIINWITLFFFYFFTTKYSNPQNIYILNLSSMGCCQNGGLFVASENTLIFIFEIYNNFPIR